MKLCENCGEKLDRNNQWFCSWNCQKKYYENVELDYGTLEKKVIRANSTITNWEHKIVKLKKQQERLQECIDELKKIVNETLNVGKARLVCENCGNNHRTIIGKSSFCNVCGKRRVINRQKRINTQQKRVIENEKWLLTKNQKL